MKQLKNSVELSGLSAGARQCCGGLQGVTGKIHSAHSLSQKTHIGQAATLAHKHKRIHGHFLLAMQFLLNTNNGLDY